MELRQLEYFVAVADESNFTRAAERVHISQSGVSAQIRQLEKELNCELFDRSSRVVRLTPAGHAALEPARHALAAAAGVEQAVDEVAGLLRGHLAIGMVTGCTITPLFAALEKFHRSHPGVEVMLRESSSDMMVGEVRSGTIDLALIGAAGSIPSGLNSMTIVSEGLCAMIPVGHSLGRRKSLSMNDIADQRIIAMPAGTGLRTAFDRACLSHGVEPVIALEASAPDAIVELAARGLGIGILSVSMADDHRDRLAAVPLVGLPDPALLAVIWPESAGPAVRALVPELEEAFAL
ncbi:MULTISPECIES: LysR substrate-binding domain-containing protein [Actinomycetes]|uniref:LysR family transcriptional regulator n=1 Tax=Actinomycetes TaxID=1760 RepID=UPI0004BF1FDF|nr:MULTISPECIES: LysR substrate-binding domain-containing protein [Actinomycetes]